MKRKQVEGRAHGVIVAVAGRIPGSDRLRERLSVRRARRGKARLAGPRLLHELAAVVPEATFIELGANDGQQLDHLRELILRTRWTGVMVEPVPHVFQRLRANYGELGRVSLENAAIGPADGYMPFYHLAAVADPESCGLPSWYDAIGSFSREHLLAHRIAIPDIESRLVRTTVPCLTFDSLCRKHGVEALDLLLIDTEGYDYEILKHADLDLHRPTLVVYEHRHLSPDDRAACRRLLANVGYDTMEEGHETWCLRRDADDRLTRLWRRLRPAVPGVAAYEEPWWGDAVTSRAQ